MIFNSPTKGRMDLKRVIQELLSFINEEPGRKYKIIIGTDSSGRGEKVDFVTALVIHRVGRGGRYFWRRIYENKKLVLRSRIYKEVTLSLDLAQKVSRKLLKDLNPDEIKQNLEIHVDVGRNGETREMIKEVVGMVRGSGFNVKTKPESYGASCVADKYV
jgi:hypothetical protein